MLRYIIIEFLKERFIENHGLRPVLRVLLFHFDFFLVNPVDLIFVQGGQIFWLIFEEVLAYNGEWPVLVQDPINFDFLWNLFQCIACPYARNEESLKLLFRLSVP